HNPVRPNVVTRVPVRIPLEVVLMLGLRLPERPGGRNLRHDLPGPPSRGLDVGDRLLRNSALLVVEVEERGAVARSDVVALTVHGRRIVDLEEELQHVPIRGLLGVEDDLDRLRVCAVVSVGRVRNLAAAVPHARRENAGSPPEEILHPPEAPSGEDRLLSCSAHVLLPPRLSRQIRFHESTLTWKGWDGRWSSATFATSRCRQSASGAWACPPFTAPPTRTRPSRRS